MKKKERCSWCLRSEEEIHYHDTEWGVPLYDDQRLFEFIILDTFQAGLSWTIVLKKRENFRAAFDNFNAEIISKYDEAKVQKLLQDAKIIRNQLKIRGTIINAQKYLEIKNNEGSFSNFIWSFVNHSPIVNNINRQTTIPSRSKESDAMSKVLIKKGFKFVGSTICYAFMQAAGMVNDHDDNCYRKQQIIESYNLIN